MSHGPIFVFCLLLAFYGLILELLVLSSFKFMDSLPLAIRDKVEESLKYQTQAINYWSAILSLGWCLVIVDITILCLLFIVIVLPKVFLDPAFRVQALQAVSATNEKEKANVQEKGLKSKSNALLLGYLLTLATLAKNAIFSRSLEDTASTVSVTLDSVLTRFHLLCYNAARSPPIIITAFVYALVFLVWIMHRTWKQQQRDKADEKTRFASVENAQKVDSDSDSDSAGWQKRPRVGFFEKVDPWTMLV